MGMDANFKLIKNTLKCNPLKSLCSTYQVLEPEWETTA